MTIRRVPQLMKLALSILGCITVLITILVSGQVSADSLVAAAPNCGANNIQSYIEEGVDFATGETGCSQTTGDLRSGITALAGRVVNIFSIVVGVTAIIMIVYGGFRYIISGGDNSRVSGAKNTLIYAIVGLIIVALAQLIVHYILNTTNGIIVNSSDLLGRVVLPL